MHASFDATKMTGPRLANTGDAMSEHREHGRAPLMGSVKFFEWNQARQADAAEISASGVFLKTDDSLPEGTHVTLRLAIPGMERAVTVLGRVVRTVKGSFLNPAGMGVRFLDLAPSVRQAISLYVARRSVGYI